MRENIEGTYLLNIPGIPGGGEGKTPPPRVVQREGRAEGDTSHGLLNQVELKNEIVAYCCLLLWVQGSLFSSLAHGSWPSYS